MKNAKGAVGCIGGLLIVVSVLFTTGQAWAADDKIGILDMQQVLSISTAGKRAENIIKKRMDSLQASLKKEADPLVALQQEIAKKGSAWSDKVKQAKITTFQEKQRDFTVKQNEADQQLKALREQHVNPILKKLEVVVSKVAKDGGYAVVLPRNVVYYATDSVDISNEVVVELNKVMK